MYKNLSLGFILLISVNSGFSQSDSLLSKTLNISSYLESYYIYDFANPDGHNRPGFYYSFNRHNEFNLNLGYIKLDYASSRTKGNLALMTGTYSRSNLAHEPTIYRMILEANVSYKLFEAKNTWITAGIFPSHLGFESAVGADCLNMSRSILAENSPYYLSGLKLYSSTKNEKWTLGLTVANGWQRIQRQPGNQLIGFGHQLTYSATEKLTVNSSSYIGSEFPDSTRRMRYFHDFYAIAQVSKKLGFIVGFDIGVEQNSKGSSSYNTWYSPILITQFKITPKLHVSARLEHYSDENEVIISTSDGGGFSTLGYSLNVDYHFSNRLLFRLEGRSLNNERNIYETEDGLTNTNTFVGSSLSLRF